MTLILQFQSSDKYAQRPEVLTTKQILKLKKKQRKRPLKSRPSKEYGRLNNSGHDSPLFFWVGGGVKSGHDHSAVNAEPFHWLSTP